MSATGQGQRIGVAPDGRLIVPERPIIPFIEGDGTGPDIWAAAVRVFDAAVERAYGARQTEPPPPLAEREGVAKRPSSLKEGAAPHPHPLPGGERGLGLCSAPPPGRRAPAGASSGRAVAWTEVLAGEKAQRETGEWLPKATVEAFRACRVGIKGPLTTPVGGGIRSLNVTLRKVLDLYVCLRPVRWFSGVPSPVRHPEKVAMVVFRENTEDLYAGLEVPAGSEEARRLAAFCRETFGWDIRPGSALGLKPISEYGSKRLIRAAIEYALRHGRRSVTLVHKGNIQKFTEGAFRQWGYDLAREAYGGRVVAWEECQGRAGPGQVLLKDAIADIFLQQILTRPDEFDVVATMNVNGDYISDALAAQVGGIGIAPGGNINYETGHALFEATHGTAPKYAGLDKVNPSSVILSGEMMFRHLGWDEAADLIVRGLERTIAERVVTYDFARLMEGAREVATSAFATAVIERMG